jgi:hypothetical protein
VRFARPLLLSVLALAVPASAHAADTGRWVQVGVTRTTLDYWQGVTTDGQGRLWWAGPVRGGYLSDLRLRESARTDNLIAQGEVFDHVGDLSYDAAEGGRLLLPLECYTAGGPNGGNTCGLGAFGVADPATLAWRYKVALDPADIPKAMWVEVSPDGRLAWTSSGDDLLAYETSQITSANAGATIRPARRLPAAVPPSGITGAVFVGERLFLAGADGNRFQVWSVDTESGAQRLEIEKRWEGESEGLVRVDAFGGELHWQVMPLAQEPTFGPGRGALVNFVRRSDAVIRVRVRRVGGRDGVRARVRAVLRYLGRAHPVARARVTLGGRRARTNASGVATLRASSRRARVVVRKAPLRTGRAVLKARK